MTDNRWEKVMKDGNGLTDKEIKDGWHFCIDWDFLLRSNKEDNKDNYKCSCMKLRE